MEDSELWKDLAIWLLDCEAATAFQVSSVKRSSKSERNRHRRICEIAVNGILSGCFRGDGSRFSTPEVYLQRVVDRAERAIT